MGILAQGDSKVLGLNSIDGLAGPGSWIKYHYEAPGNLHIREVIVTCSKLDLGQLIQIHVMDSVRDKLLKTYLDQIIKLMTSSIG